MFNDPQTKLGITFISLVLFIVQSVSVCVCVFSSRFHSLPHIPSSILIGGWAGEQAFKYGGNGWRTNPIFVRNGNILVNLFWLLFVWCHCVYFVP